MSKIEQILKEGFEAIDQVVFSAHEKLDLILIDVHADLFALKFISIKDIRDFYKDLFFWVEDDIFQEVLEGRFHTDAPFKLSRINPPKIVPTVYVTDGYDIHSFELQPCRTPINQFIPWC